MFGRTRETVATYSREWLRKFIHDGEAFLEAARSYAENMTGQDITVKPGHYYETYNGSVVYVACKHKNDEGDSDNPVTSLLRMMKADAEKDDPKKDEPESKDYLTVILRGGHGVSEFRGEGPGEAYLVAINGEVKLPHNKEKKGELSDLSGKLLALVGLTIKKECSAP